MDYKKYNISQFTSEISNQLKHVQYKKIGFENIDRFPLIKGKQCLYVVNWKQSKITYSKGARDMLGYSKEEFTMDNVVNNVHPDDLNFVNRIVKGIVNHSVNNNVSGEGQYLLITYRLKKKDGTYINVLRKTSAYEIDNRKNLVSNFSLLTDISFMSNNKVEWDVYTKNLNIEGFKSNIQKEFSGFFSKREFEIITLIKNGLSSKAIAEKLHLSYHTISTHRKNVLRKSRCTNVAELLSFCQKNGIL